MYLIFLIIRKINIKQQENENIYAMPVFDSIDDLFIFFSI